MRFNIFRNFHEIPIGRPIPGDDHIIIIIIIIITLFTATNTFFTRI